MANDNKRKLYDALSQDYDMGSYEQFCADIDDEGKRRKLYDATSGEYDYGSWDSFSQQLGYGSSGGEADGRTGRQADGPTGRADLPGGEDELTGGRSFTEEEMAQRKDLGRRLSMGKVRGIVASAGQLGESGRQAIADQLEYGRLSAARYGQAVSAGKRVDFGSGEVVEDFLTPTGERMTDRALAEETSRQYRMAADMSVGGQLRRAYRERAELDRKAQERLKAVTESEEPSVMSSILSSGDPMMGGMSSLSSPNTRGVLEDAEYQQYRQALREVNEKIQTLENRRDSEKGDDIGFWRGFGQTAGNIETWTAGVTDALGAMAKLSAAGSTTESAQELKRAVAENDAVQSTYGDFGFWNRAGVMAGYMPSFMLDFAITGGGFGGLNVVGKAAARGAVRTLGKEAVEEMASIGVKAYAKKYGVRGVGRMAGNWTVKALGTTADDLLVRAPLMTNTVQAAKTAADIVDRKVGDVVVDENGNYDFSNDKTWGSAVWQGEANAIIENYSEMFGAHLDGAVPALAKVFGGKRISGMLARANASSYGQILATTRKQFERLGVSDYFGEVAEEYYGQLWRTMLNLDDAYTNVPVPDKDGNQVIGADGQPVYERKNLLATGQFHGDIWGGMALSMGLMGAGKYTMSGAAYGNMKHQVNRADCVAAEVFTPDRWEPIREIIDSTTNEDMGVLAENFINDDNLSDEERAAVMEYVERSLNLRGLNLGAMARGRGAAEVNSVDSELSESYIDGYGATSDQEMNDAQNMYEYQRRRAEGVFEPSILDWLDSNPVAALMDIFRNGLFSQGEIDAARDYVNAKSVREGILQRVSDDIDEKIARSDAMIHGRVNRATGMIQPAVMGLENRNVYVVGGALGVNSDGSIDREASDETIVVRDAETGELEFADPRSIVQVGEAIDPEMEKAMAVDNIRQQAAQAAADALNGTLAFNPGDVVSIDDGGGMTDVTIVGPVVDEESGVAAEDQVLVQFPDGQRTAFAKEQLQAFADAANRERVNQYEEERAVQRAQQQEVEAEVKRPQLTLNDEFTILNDAGNPVRGSITGELDEDGMVEIYTEEPVNGKRVNRVTPAELEGMISAYSGAQADGPTDSLAAPDEASGAEAPNLLPMEGPEVGSSAGPEVGSSAGPEVGNLRSMPVGADGEPDFEAVEADRAWDAMVEGLEDESMAAMFVQRRIEELESALKRAQKEKPKSTGFHAFKAEAQDIAGRVAGINARLEKWRAIAGVPERRTAERQAEELAAMEAEKKRKAALDRRVRKVYDDVRDVPEAVDVLEQMNPVDIHEVAAYLLSGQKVLWSDDGVKKGAKSETGFGEGERQRLFGLFASSANGGVSLSRLAEDPMQQLCEMYGVAYDNQEARNALIDVIRGAGTVGDIRNYIANNRIEQALAIKSDYDRYVENEAERALQEEYHLSAGEVEAYEEQRAAELKKNALTDADVAEMNGIFADEIKERKGYEENIGNEQGGGTGVLQTGSAVLPVAGVDNIGGVRTASEGEGGTWSGGGADRAYGAAPAGTGREILQQPERRGQGDLQDTERRQPGTLSETEVDENGLPFVKADNGTTSFGEIREESGLPGAPIKLSEGYQDENGKGYGLRHIEAGHGEEIRNAGFSSVEEFVSYVAKNYDEDNIRVGKRRRNGNTTYLIQVTDSHDNTLFIELSRDGSYWNVNSGGIFRKGYSNKKETVAKTEPQQPNDAVSGGSSLSKDEQSGTSTIEPNGEPTVSGDEVNTLSPDKQGEGEKSSVLGASEGSGGAEQTGGQADGRTGDVGTGTASDSGQGGDLAKPSFMDAVKALYEKGREFASSLFQRKYFDVVETPDFMKTLGLRGDKFTIRFGVISRHFGKDSDHNLPIEVWEQLPQALQKPFAITRHFERKGEKTAVKGYRIYTTLRHNDKYVIVGADVKVAGKGLEINAIETAFAITSPSELEEVIYTSNEITPDQQSLLDGRNSRQYTADEELYAGKGSDLLRDKQGEGEESSVLGASDSGELAAAPDSVAALSAPKKRKKARPVNINSYTDKKNPVFSGVMHYGGYRWATDGVLMVREKADYGTDLEGKMVDKSGHEVAKHPTGYGFEKAIALNGGVKVDISRVEALCKAAKGAGAAVIILRTEAGVHAFGTKRLSKMLNIASRYGVTELSVNEHGRLGFEDDGIKAVMIHYLRSAGEKALTENGLIRTAYGDDFAVALEKAEAHNGFIPLSAGEGGKTNREVYEAGKSLIESAGIPVIEVSDEEAQAMLGQKNTPVAGQPNRANEKPTSGSVLLSAKGDSSSNANVPSEASTKISKDTQRAKNNIKKFNNGDATIEMTTVPDAIRSIGNLLSMRSKGGSRYTILRTDGGNTVAIRLSDHRANGNNFRRDEADRNLSVVIERRRYDSQESDIEYTEAVIPLSVFEEKPDEVVKSIVNGVEDVLADKPFTLDSGIGTVEGGRDDSPVLLKTPAGTVYGWVSGGKVYLNRDAMNGETPLHEYTHLWDEMVRRENPELWERGKALLKDTPLWEAVVNDPNYADIAGDDDAVASEVHARLTGRDGAKLLQEMIDKSKREGAMETAKAVTLVERIKGWLSDMFKVLKATLGKWSKRDLKNLTVEDFGRMVLRDLAEGMNPRHGDRTLVGVHNISEQKLFKALRIGGLVNPSVAVIDINRGRHEGYGEISLVLPSSKIDKGNGNAGTWPGDAWTPTYPTVERRLEGEGADLPARDMANLPSAMRDYIRRAFNGWLDGRGNEGLAYWFLHERGEAPEVVRRERIYTVEESTRILRAVSEEDVFGGLTPKLLSKLTEEERAKVKAAFIKHKFGGDEAAYEEAVSTNRSVWEKLVKDYPEGSLRHMRGAKNLAKLEKTGLLPAVESWLNEVRDDRAAGNKKLPENTSLEANRIINDRNLRGEFDKWVDGLTDRYGIEEVIFDGYTPSGNRRYVKNTAKNVSRLMREQGRNAATGWGSSFSRFVAAVMRNMPNRESIREEKGRLTTEAEAIEAFDAKWGEVFLALGMKCQPEANGRFDDYGLERLTEAAGQKNPAGYLKKEYGVELSGDDVMQLMAMIDAIRRERPAKYFETKFERPVQLDEFAAAVVPETIAPELEKAMAAAGLNIVKYDATKEGDRQRALREASDDRNVRFQIVGERGAERIHMSEDGRRDEMPSSTADIPREDRIFLYRHLAGRDRTEMSSAMSRRKEDFDALRDRAVADRIKELAERMHLDNVEILTDASQLEGIRAKAKGFYNKRTGKIAIVIPNNVSTIDAEQTLLHEAVAHYGLRQLFGEQFNTFLDNVYQSADESIRRKIAEMAAQNGWDFRTATEEYLAGLAEDTNFAEARREAGWWSKIKSLFLDMVEAIGFKGFRDKAGVVLTDNELRYILWRSYENLTEATGVGPEVGNLLSIGNRLSILGEAKDVAMQSELKVGNYAEHGIEAEYAAEPISETSRLFNVQLRRYMSGEMSKQEILMLGEANGVLRNFLPNLPIVMRQRILSKASETKHNVSIESLIDLPAKIAQPIFVFQRDKDTIGVLTEIKDRDGKNVCVAIELNKTIQDGGSVLEVNDVRSIHGRDSENIILPILHNNTLRYADKKKGLAWLSSASSNYQQEIAVQDLEDAAKIVKSFENPTVEEEELFRPGDFTPRDKVLARDTYERIVGSGSYQFQEAVQDSMLGLRTLYGAVLGNKTRIEDVAGFENAYLFENRMSSMNAGEQHEYYIRYMAPLLKEIGRIAGADERKRKDLTDYMMAKHGLERNEYMREEARSNGEDTERDFAGLTAMTGEKDWQKAEETARQLVADYESTTDTGALWQAVRAATGATLEKVYTSGIISKETYEKIRGMYNYYIPLRGWDETTSEQVYGYLTSNNGPLGGCIMKAAKGRSSKADDPIATIAMMADDAIRQGNRNLMKQRFLNFVLNRPSDAVSVHDIWLEHDEVSDEWRPVFADIGASDSADEVEQKVSAFEERMKELREAEPEKYKKGREAQHIPYKVVRNNMREHQVLIKRNGRTYVATINGNPRAAQALNGLTNPDVDQNGVVGNMLKAGTWINRQLSAFYTTRNPDFVAGNFFRDMLYSNCMMWVKESTRYARRFHKNFGKVNPLVMRRLLGKWEAGTLDMSDVVERHFYQFMKNGGETGYTNVRDIEGHKRAVSAELKKQGSMGRRAWTALGMQFDLLNRSAENCARFAAFVTSREFGRSIDRAIYDAKEVSVNFNKKGSGGKMVNATGQTVFGKAGAYLGGGGRIAFVFWNAGIQGMVNFGRQAKAHPAKFMAGSSALFALGFVIPLLAQMLAGGDDDDKNAYYNLPEYVRRSNICFRAGEQWITIPLPIEYRALYGLGELAQGVISGNERYSNEELAYNMASQVSQIMPLDMLEGGGGVSPFIPSAAKPFTEAYIMNKGWTGLPVYKDTPFNKNAPEWTKAYASADTHLVAFAKWLNETSGGDDFKKGAIDINPAKIEYLLNGTFGGVFTFPNKAKKAGETAFGDRAFEWRNMPIANRLVKSGDERTANRKLRNEYFNYKKEYEATGELMRKYENADANGVLGYAERLDFLYNSPEYGRWEVFDGYKADIDAYREAIAAETDDEARAELEAEMYSLMREMVEKMREIRRLGD